jgi:hypothetical protein
VVSLASAGVGVAVMALAAAFLEGTARVVALGLGHSFAYAVGALVLVVGLTRRTATSLRPAAIGRVAAVSAAVGLAGWAASEAVLGADPGRLAALLTVLCVGAVGALAIVAGYRGLGVAAALSPRTVQLAAVAPQPVEPEVLP